MKLVTKFFKVVKKFGEVVSNVINSVLLFFVYVFGIGLTSIVAKLFKKHFLDLKLFRKKKTYWSDIKPHKKESYYRQF